MRKLLFVTGQSGAGKTTLGNNLKEQYGFVHFDGDVFAHGGDATAFSGIPTPEMVARTDPQLKRIYADCATNAFGGLFVGRDVALAEWQPFVDLLLADVARKWAEAAPSSSSMVVTWSVYPKSLRDYVRTQLPDVQFVVLCDAGGASRRKARQTIEQAHADGKTLAEFLSTFGIVGDDATEAALQTRMAAVQRGFEAASGDEFGIDVTDAVTSADVLAQVAAHFALESGVKTD
jgi:gluconate kinase